MKKPVVDVRVEGLGSSVVLFRPLTKAARVWLEEHTDGTWWCGSLAVEHRYVGDLAEGLRGDGLNVRAV